LKLAKLKPQGLELADSKKLIKLAQDIRASYKDAETAIEEAGKRGSAAYALALTCGLFCNEAKEILSHGRWLDWLAKHCKGVSETTVRRYMRLARNTTALSDLKSGKRLIDAYIDIGILPPLLLDKPPDASMRAAIGAPTAPPAQLNPPVIDVHSEPVPPASSLSEPIQARALKPGLLASSLPALFAIQSLSDELAEQMQKLEPGEQRKAASDILKWLEDWI
jgi:hypothetical protein